MKVEAQYWKGKRVLVTGHTGFKGAWMCLLLERLGAKVAGFALAPNVSPALYEKADIAKSLSSEKIGDLRDLESMRAFFKSFDPEIIFHMAAQPIVAESFATPIETHTVNIIGTANLLEVARTLPKLKSVIVITTDKVYLNEGGKHPFLESDPLGGSDPYSASKACAEIITRSFAESFLLKNGISVNTVRAGNIVGGGDWSAYRLVPDVIRSAFNKQELVIRMPHATRPWQHVLDALVGYLHVAQKMAATKPSFEAWNFGPVQEGSMTVAQVLDAAKTQFPELKWRFEEMPGVKESVTLALNSTKARGVLDWKPRFDFEETIRRTMSWYKEYYQGQETRAICSREIDQVLS